MPSDRWNALNDAPVFPPERFGLLADRLGRILRTRNDILLFQTEAVVALEAVTASLARPGLKAINIVTSPFGAWFGGWLRRGGAEVVTLAAEPARPVAAEAVSAAFDAHPDTKAVIFCHAESANGVLNPLEEIVAAARARGIVTVVDAVASVGGHALDVDALGIDVAVIGPQKSLAGPAGVSALSVSPAAWRLITAEGAPRDSTLSLLDRKAWLDAGRGALPGTSAALEFFALEAALDRFGAEGLDARLARHARGDGRARRPRGPRRRAMGAARPRLPSRHDGKIARWRGHGRLSRRRRASRYGHVAGRRSRRGDPGEAQPHGPARAFRSRARQCRRLWHRPSQARLQGGHRSRGSGRRCTLWRLRRSCRQQPDIAERPDPPTNRGPAMETAREICYGSCEGPCLRRYCPAKRLGRAGWRLRFGRRRR